ncbi:MAG: hypothetical protein LUE08_04025, partial [Akkermansiaceae bacterium]|nr:hypothetical protein [Akkermansiaceae bacterium]
GYSPPVGRGAPVYPAGAARRKPDLRFISERAAGRTVRLITGSRHARLWDMKLVLRLIPAVVCACACAQCARVQTAKQVSEAGTVYRGYHLGSARAVWQRGGRYYIRCEERNFTLSPPWVRDSVLLTDLRTTFAFEPKEKEAWGFHPVSRELALALTQTSGCDMAELLHKEIASGGGAWIPAAEFPAASAGRIPITADLGAAGADSADQVVAVGIVRQMWPPLRWTLTALDAVAVDVPGTVLYNGLIPLITPFAAFREAFAPNPL